MKPKAFLAAALVAATVIGAGAETAVELPPGYTAVDWIESTTGGGQYINTGYKPNLSTVITADFNSMTRSQNWAVFFGATKSDSSSDGVLLRYSDNDINGWFCNGEYGEARCSGLANSRITAVLKAGGMTLNGRTSTITTSGTPYDGPIYLFCGNNGGEAWRHQAMRLYSFKITEGEEVKRNFVPCVRESDFAVGLYDLAASDPSKAFYANAGSGKFGVPEGTFCTVTVGAFANMTGAYTFGDGSKTNAISGSSFEVLKGTVNVTVIFTAKRNYAIEGSPVIQLEGTVTDDIVFGDGNDYAVPTAVCALGNISYLDWDDVNGMMTNATISVSDYELVTSETREFAGGKWYVVAGNVVIDNGGNIKVNGSAHLILCDNASLTIKNVATDTAAIDVSVSGSTTNSLAIYGQPGGSGVLSATGGQYGAGIGGGWYGADGTVTINGGKVAATGGVAAAGIGGGYKGAGGTVSVNGGIVTATGGSQGAGIGGGSQGAGGVVTINGGTVTATGGEYGAGIGGGSYGAGGTVTVNGGTVSATGGTNGAGIGGGWFSAGIGGGTNDDHGTVTFGAGAWLVLAGASAPGSEVSAADYANDHSERYVCIKPLLSLKIPAGVHYSYVVSNETAGAELKGVLADGTNTYMVVKGATVKVYFTLEESYEWYGEFDNPKDLGVIESDKVVDASEMPKGLPGSDTNPWKVGENVTAYIKDRVLCLKGTGAMDDFASAADAPWAAVADQVTAVTVADGVTLGKNALAGFVDTVTVNGLTIAFQKMTAVSAGSEPPAPVPPPGAVTTWDALTNAVVTAESGAVIAVGADINEAGGELVVPMGKAVTIKLYGKTVSCGRVTVGGALTVGDAEDSVGRIVASNGAKVAKGGSVTLLGGPMRGTFTTLSPGLILLFK